MSQSVEDLLKQLETRVAQRKLHIHKPYGLPETLCPDGELWKRNHATGLWGEWSNRPWQVEFHEAGADNQERMLICANRVGKCLNLLTKIDTSTGKKKIKDVFGKQIEVLTYPDKEPRKILSWIRKPAEECFRVTMSDGQWFECPKGHLILTDLGFVSFGEILTYLPDSVVHAQDFLEGVRRGVLHLTGRLRGWWGRYFVDSRLNGGRLLSDQDNVQVFFPLPTDVPRHTSALYNLGGLANKYTSNLLQAFARLSNQDVVRRVLGLFSVESQAYSCGSVSFASEPQSGSRCRRLARLQRLTDEAHSHQCRSSSYQIPSVCGNSIVSVQSVGVHTLYDMEVEGRHQYLAAGICHHNSESGGYEAALHMTGQYPDWWTGRRFDKPILLWTGSPTNETSRDIIQKALLGGTSPDELGKGFIPRENIVGRPKMRQAGVSDVVDAFKVRHASGGISTCILKTYEQGWRKWQGTEPEVVWMDEEPDDYKIYLEALTRLLTSHGLMMVTFTPLLGQTTLVRHYHDATHDGVWLGHATWNDAPHLLKKERDRLEQSYPSWQVQARTMGVPMMGEGAIFTTPEPDVVVKPFQIPNHWPQIKGIDFGMGHPFGYAKLAYDRDSDIVYLIDCYRKADKMAPYHAERVKGTTNWIPVAWPHDGHKRDSKGIEFQKMYRNLNVNMLSKSARYTNDTGGPQGVWNIIEQLKEREETGRFKIFDVCHEYREERRNYHIKRDKNDVAEIVVRRDDTLKAAFYALMMLRKAKTYSTSGKRKSRPPTVSCMSTRV